MNKKLLVTLLAVLSVQTAVAAKSIAPTACPSVGALQSVGVSALHQNQRFNTWLAMEWNNKFDTTSEWTLAVGQYPLADKDQVITKARAALASLSLNEGPFEFTDPDTNTQSWGCIYRGETEIYAVTVTPAHAASSAFSMVR